MSLMQPKGPDKLFSFSHSGKQPVSTMKGYPITLFFYGDDGRALKKKKI